MSKHPDLNAQGIWPHAGDLGDLIYALPVIRQRGGGKLVLHRCPGKVREPWNPAKYEAAAPLLRQLPYITEVVYVPAEMPGSNIDGFRHHRAPTLLAMQAATQGLRPGEVDLSPWIEVDPLPAAEIVLHRSPRYRTKTTDWRRTLEWADAFYGHPTVGIVGSASEHADLQETLGRPVQHLQTPTVLDLARVIAGAELFIGNQSSPFSIALGLGVPSMLEVYPPSDNCRIPVPHFLPLR